MLGTGLRCLYFFLFIVAQLLIHPCDSQPVTCHIPSVEKGQTTTLTCDFQEDLLTVDVKPDLLVQVYRDDEHDEKIMQCDWLNATYQCSVFHNNFTLYDKNISRYLTLNLLYADESAEGNYTCQKIGDWETSVPRTCVFRLKKDYVDVQCGAACEAAIMAIVCSAIVLLAVVVCWRQKDKLNEYWGKKRPSVAYNLTPKREVDAELENTGPIFTGKAPLLDDAMELMPMEREDEKNKLNKDDEKQPNRPTAFTV